MSIHQWGTWGTTSVDSLFNRLIQSSFSNGQVQFLVKSVNRLLLLCSFCCLKLLTFNSDNQGSRNIIHIYAWVTVIGENLFQMTPISQQVWIKGFNLLQKVYQVPGSTAKVKQSPDIQIQGSAHRLHPCFTGGAFSHDWRPGGCFPNILLVD